MTPPGMPSLVRNAQAETLTPADQALKDHLVELLTLHDGNVAAVGRAMGKGRMQIHRWARRFGIDLDSFRHGS